MAMSHSTKTTSVNLWRVALAVFLFMISPAHAFIRHLCFNPLGFARVDPIMSPDVPSQHLHHLHGSSNLGLSSLDAQDFLQGNCTSCSITFDRSGYWTPAMYFQHENGTFELMTTASAITVYYKLEKRINFENQNYSVFPQGLRMIAGSSMKRTWDGPWPVPDQSNWGPNDTSQAALAEKSIGFNCLNYVTGPAEPSFGYPWLRNKTFIDAQCVDGVRAEIMFPSCWDGINLDSPDHKSHVAYPNLIQDGACPDTHPVYLPILFYETIWNTQQFAGASGQFVMSNGDPTGYGYHGDFFAAWQDGVLQQIFNDPTCTDHDLLHRASTGLQQDCDTIKASLQTEDVAAECKLEMPEVLAKDEVSGLIDMLPGDVKITGTRHDPGTPPAQGTPVVVASSAAASGPTPSSTMDSSSSQSIPSAATASSSSSSTYVAASVTSQESSVPTTSAVEISTTTYISDGVLVELVVIETIVTVTVAAIPSPTVLARRRHAHGHGHGHPTHL